MANLITGSVKRIPGGGRYTFALFFCCLISVTVLLPVGATADNDSQYDRDEALQRSQFAIGNTLSDHRFTATDGHAVRLSEYLGKPLLISMIFTSCHHVCPTITKHIDRTTRAAQDALGDGSFSIISVGFDTQNDTPEAMRAFARHQNVDADNWQFLSATPETIANLSHELGFQFFVSPRGFDHLNQVSMIDRQGKVYSQIYGVNFELPWLVEPLKQLVLNRPESKGHPISALVDRVRLFCTVYNPATGRYEFDNSLFIQIVIGFMVVFSIAMYLWRETRRASRN